MARKRGGRFRGGLGGSYWLRLVRVSGIMSCDFINFLAALGVVYGLHGKTTGV